MLRMADAQAKLMAALRKNAADEPERPRPAPAPAAAPSDQGVLKLRKSNLLGTVTPDEAIRMLSELNRPHEYEACTATITKMFGNVLANPAEPKYRKIRSANPNFTAKVYSCKGAPELFRCAGFRESKEEPGFLILPAEAGVAPLQRVLDALAANATARAEAEEKKRKHEQDRAREAREARAAKARAEAEPGQYDAAVANASGSLVDEDEAMIAAIEDFMDANPELKAGRAIDSYAIERQTLGAGGGVVVSVAASAGTSYFDYRAYMKRSGAGEWSVQKIEEAP